LTANRLRHAPQKKEAKGYDGYKKVNGRKRHILVDTLGFIMTVKVTSAGVQERDVLEELCEKIRDIFLRLHTIFADGGYEGRQNKIFLKFGWLLHITRRPNKKANEKGVFSVLPKRWIVERTFAWLGLFRRLSVDYELSSSSAEAFIKIANISLLLNRLK